MRILFSITYYAPYISGLTICAQRLAENLAQENTVSVVALRHQPTLPVTEEIAKVSVHRAIPLIQLHKGFFSVDWFFRCLRLVRENEVIVINVPQLEGIVPAILGRLLGKRVISIYHCEIQLPAGFMNRCIQTIVELSHRCTLGVSHQIVTYTNDYRDHMPLLSNYKDKTVAILPPVPVPHLDENFQKKLQKIIPTSAVVIGIASRLATEKGIEYLLEALPLLNSAFKKRKVVIVMAGPLNPVGEESYKQKIFSLVESYKDQVIFLGSLSQREIGAFYHILDVLALPSINSTEAFGIVQVEAMLCGVPVVTSDLYGVREVVHLSKMGIVVPVKDTQALAEAIVRIVQDKKHFIQSKKTIVELFSIDKTFNSYKKILENNL